MTNQRIRRSGFTLSELLVVIGIIAVIFSLLTAGIQRARASAARLSAVNNLSQLGVAINSYHAIHKKYPTEQGNNPSIFKTLLPFVEQGTATDSIEVSLYLCPTRRSANAGAKRDFGFAASTAHGSVGPSVLDSENVSLGMITSSGKRASNTALLSTVWMSPSCYSGGDPTDTGWAAKLNARANVKSPKRDSDPTGNSTYLGGPFDFGVPTLFADGHVEPVAYTSQGWAYYWAYKLSPNSKGHWIKVWRDGTVTIEYQEDIDAAALKALQEAMKDGYLTNEEADLLRNLSTTDYNKYLQLHEEWKKTAVKKGDSGETLTTEESAYYKQYKIDEKNYQDWLAKQKADQEAYAAQQKFQQDAINKGNAGLPLDAKEQAYYDQWLKDQAAAKAAAEAKAKAAADAAALKQWQDNAVASKGGTTPEEKAFYDKYLADQKAAADKAAADKAKYEQQQQLYQWQQDAIRKAQSGESLTYEEQQYYSSYQQQLQQTQSSQSLAQQKAQQELQQRMTSYIESLNGSSGGTPTATGNGYYEWVWVPN